MSVVYQPVQCAVCQGTGKRVRNPFVTTTCDACRGKGWVYAWTNQ